MTVSHLPRALGAALLALIVAAPLPALAIDSGGDSPPASHGAGSGGSMGGGGMGSGSGGGNSGGGHSLDTRPMGAVPTLATARADIAAHNWSKAIADLTAIVKASPTSADAYNLLGFSYRSAGNYSRAGAAYARALKLDPRHTGALEYQGVLFVKLGQLDKAKANLGKIKTICGTSCEAYKDLAKAIG